jgi:Pentapeptide repeats (9 copies)
MIDGPPQPADDNIKAMQRRRLIWRLAGVGLLVLGLLVVLLACILLVPRLLYPPLTPTDLQGVSDKAKVQELIGARLKLQNDARTTLLQGLGALLVLTGAGIGANVTLRQVRATRDQIRETATASRNQLKLSEQGQVTDRYTRAVEQLGHEKAPVRLGALYSLEHLAQDNPEYRQTVVDVVCAYLRMPYTLPAQPEMDAKHMEQAMTPAEDGIPPAHPAPGQNPVQEELQVRRTVQRLLSDHLRFPPRTSGREAQLLPPSPQQTFWPGISLDLTGATLVNFTLSETSVIEAMFVGATFQGDTWFEKATFQGNAWFARATFQGNAGFGEATFQGTTLFGKVTFQGWATFAEATFQADSWFGEATFSGDTWFKEATFKGNTGFNEATFQSNAWFDKATFQGNTGFDRAHVLHFDDDLGRGRVWPDGWAVRPDPTDPSRGTLVRAEDEKERKPTVPLSDPTDSGSGRS